MSHCSNGSVWGEGAALVVDMLARVMIRWSSEDEKEEYELTRAMNVGISEGKYYREEYEYIDCDELFNESCSTSKWNEFVLKVKLNLKNNDTK